MTPRGTDWSLAALVALGAVTGLATWFSGAPSTAWVYATHAIGGAALAAVVTIKVRRVRSRLAPRDQRGLPGLVALGLVAAALITGVVWSSGGRVYPAGMSLLVWHGALGAVLATAVLAHARTRAKPPRRRDVADRRQFLAAAAIAGVAFAAQRAQRPAQRLLGLGGARRRFTGSYDAGAFTGNAFPTTSWLADRPRPVDAGRFRLSVDGLVERPLALTAGELDRGDALAATLDCTGGFYSQQRWEGVALARLLAEAGASPAARHVSVVSRTGYRWSFGIDATLLLATRVGGEPLAHGHGAPCRLVAPGRRGLEWVKWVERVEVREDPDPGALLTTLTSGFSTAGRGA